MNQLLQNHLPALKRVFRENSVKKAYAFGSVCTDAFREVTAHTLRNLYFIKVMNQAKTLIFG